MREVLNQYILDNSIRSYLEVIGVILLALIVKRVISRYLTGILFRLITKAGRKFNKEAFCNLLLQPLEVFLLVLVIIVSFDQLTYPAAWNIALYKVKFHSVLDGLANTTLVVVFIWLCLRIIDFIATVLEDAASLTKSQSDNQLIVFFKDFLKVVLIIIGGLLLIRFVFHQNIGNLLTGLSIVGAALALATRESLENLIASFIIFFDKPFVTGDTVKVHNFTGSIEKIGLRSTRIRTVDKTYISVPNKQMVDSIVDNISLRTQRKAELRLELKLSVTTEQLRKFLDELKVIIQHPQILRGNVYFTETGKNANIVTLEYFAGIDLSDEQFNELKQEIYFRVMGVVEQTGIEFEPVNIDPVFLTKQS
jgi:MscS family membrane protein